MKRPLMPAPSQEERKQMRRFTWKMLLVGMCANVVGLGIRLVTARTMGAMPRAHVQQIGKLSVPEDVGE